MTKIITTIGPASQEEEVLNFFKEHSVAITRLNFSHNSPQWHIEVGKKCRQAGFILMADLAGPKILLGSLRVEKTTIKTKEQIVIETQDPKHEYPYHEEGRMVLPCQFHIEKFVKAGQPILIDDGKIQCVVAQVEGNKVICDVQHGGLVKSNKGVNLPLSSIDIDFLVERDRRFLSEIVPVIRPEYVAPSFVKTKADLDKLKNFLQSILAEHNITDYYPKICTKVEMGEAVESDNLRDIVEHSDMIMIARGDLALETLPNHIKVPFYQAKIKLLCKQTNTPFVVATQMLETMCESPVPTRAEMSDLYRAVVIDQADYVMLSGETAVGQFPTKCVELMHDMITQSAVISQEVLDQ